MRTEENKLKKGQKVYMVYDGFDESIKILTKNKTNALTKFGDGILRGDCVESYKFIEFNLDEIEE